MKNISWKRVLLTLGGLGLTIGSWFIEDTKQRDDIREAVAEQLAEMMEGK